MREAYPATMNPVYARLMLSLLMPRRVAESLDGDGQVILWNAGLIADCMGRGEDYRDRHMGEDSTGRAIADFRTDVLPDLVVNQYVKKERVRTVHVEHLNRIISPELRTAIERDLNTDPSQMSERVYLDTGAGVTAKNRSREHQRWRRAMAHEADRAGCELAADLIRLLHSADLRRFGDLPSRYSAAAEIARKMQSKKGRTQTLRELRHIADYPYPWYTTSEFSPRVFPKGISVAGIASACRRALLPDSYEVDLASAHLAIVAAEWGCERLFAFLDAEQSFWPLILDWMALDSDCPHAKAAVKRGTYGLVYGAGVKRIVEVIRDEYEDRTTRELPKETAERFLSHELVQEVKEARDHELARLRAELNTIKGGVGYVVDCFGRKLSRGQMEYGDGRKLPVRGPKAARSILSQLGQARELDLMAPIIRGAEQQQRQKRGADWWVTSWNHDGCSIQFRRRPETYLIELAAGVGARADTLAIPTRLEVKWRPGDPLA